VQPTALIAFCTFIPAYVQRDSEHDLAYWLLFMLIFIIDTVLCVMNAYNNITWVSVFLCLLSTVC
jgi:threonine/homoserine/homoserine lactone efflux protein